jgi:hypothetical protein
MHNAGYVLVLINANCHLTYENHIFSLTFLTVINLFGHL